MVVVSWSSAADFPEPYDSEKTPGDPMPAEEAAAKWKLPEGFKVTVFASEPEVRNPIACAWDNRGRLWVAENFTYAERTLKFDPKLRDRILIFEDTDGDGRHDKRTVFTDEVQHVTSVEVGLGGVWLIAPPQVLFIPDRNGDDRPDGSTEVVLDGFTVPPENHHNFANGLRWGPDGWLYGRCGASAPARVGAPGTPDAERTPVAGGIWRYHPMEKTFEALCHGTTNPWGHDWDENGECFFTNTVNGHLWHMIPGAHYTRPHTIDPNPHSYELIDQHADHYHFDTGKGWESSRDAASGSDALGGGHAHCGAMIYLGDNWPASYRGKLMTLNFHGRRINVERLERQGSGYVGKHEPDIGFSADPFFRGIDLTYGPDGGVYVLDWSDTGECHENTGVHRTSGRIYKITYGEVKKPAVSDLTKLSNEELAKLHEHQNEWYVRIARRTLADRMAAGAEIAIAVSALRKHLDLGANPKTRLRALQTLHVLNALNLDMLSKQMVDQRRLNEHVRAWAVRFLVDALPIDTADGKRLRENAKIETEVVAPLQSQAALDPSPLVRLVTASSLQRVSVPWRSFAQDSLVVKAFAADHNLPLVVWYGIAPLAESHPEKLVEIAESCELPTTRRLIARRLALEIEKKSQLIEDLLKLSQWKTAEFQADILAGLLEGFTGWRKAPKPIAWGDFVEKTDASTDAALKAKVRELSVLFGDGRALDDVKRIALDGKSPMDARKAALQTLIDARPGDLRGICEKLLTVRFLNTIAARGLALFDDPAIGTKLAQSYRSFHPSERAAVVDALVARSAFARALLAEVAAGKIAKAEISAFHARQIRSFGDAELTKQLGEVWGELRESSGDKRAAIAQLKASLTTEILAKADLGAGRVAFNQVCASCHALYGHGGQIGPDLTGSGRANLDYLLENIVDPGAVVNADFRLSILTLRDGRVLNGTIAAKTDRTLTLKTMTEPMTIERSEIARQEELPQSLMPEGLLSALTGDQVRDLFAYLMHPSQVPLPAANP